MGADKDIPAVFKCRGAEVPFFILCDFPQPAFHLFGILHSLGFFIIRSVKDAFCFLCRIRYRFTGFGSSQFQRRGLFCRCGSVAD